MKVLITGAKGLLGQLTRQAIRSELADYIVVATDTDTTAPSARYTMENKQHVWTAPDFEITPCDLTQESDVHQLMETVKPDIVIHLAGALENADPSIIQAVNVEGTRHVFDACVEQGVSRVIYASSVMTVFGYLDQAPYSQLKTEDSDEKINESSFPPIGVDAAYEPARDDEKTLAYCQSKIAVEKMAKVYSKQHPEMTFIGLRPVWVTPDDCHGDGWKARLFPCTHAAWQAHIVLDVTAKLQGHHLFYVASKPKGLQLLDHTDNRQKLGFDPNNFPTQTQTVEESPAAPPAFSCN